MNVKGKIAKSRLLVDIFIIFIVFSLMNSKAVFGTENRSLDQLLLEQISQIEKLSPVIYNPGKEWFRANGSILDAPKNDFRFKIIDQNSNKTISYIFYFDTSKSTGYLQKRGGISDIVTWFGPITISHELGHSIETYRCNTNKISNY